MASPAIDYSQILNGNTQPWPIPYLDPYTGMPMNMNQSQTNPSVAMKQNYGQNLTIGRNLASNLTTQQQNTQDLQSMYGNAATTAGTDLLNHPGYTSSEESQIINPAAWNAGVTTPDQYASLAPTSGETSGMMGDPSSYTKWTDPLQGQIAGNVQSGADQTDNALTNATAQMGIGLGQEAGTFGDALGNENLNPSQAYADAMSGSVAGARSGVTAALDPAKLALNLDPSYQMSNGEVSDIENQAGQAAAMSRQQQNKQIQMAAAASGNSDPMALAALNYKTQAKSSSDAANATTSARIQAEDAQRQTEMNYAMGNLGANQTSAGMRSSAAMGLGQMGMTAAQQQEQAQTSAAQYEAALETGQATTLANQGNTNAQWTGAQSVNNAQNWANLFQSGLENSVAQGTAANESSDQAAAARAAQVYGIRQGNTQYGQQSTFSQNATTQAQLAALYSQAAAARINGTNTGLNWATGEQSGQMGQNNNLNNQQLQAALGTQNLESQNTGQWGNYTLGQGAQSFGTNFTTGLASALGKGIGAAYTGAAFGG